MLKVVQLQYSTMSGGSSALRMQHAFTKEGISSTIISLLPDDHTLENITYLKFRHRITAKINNRIESFLLRGFNKDYGLFSLPVFGHDVSKMEAVKNADIIYIHWVQHGFLNLSNITAIAKLNKPVVIILHDMWSITGGCHYSFNCDNYLTGCKACPVLPNNHRNNLAAAWFNKKKRIYEKYKNLYFVSPSKWLFNCAQESLLTRDKPVFYIPNFLDTTLFKPTNKETAKYILNIDKEISVVTFGAISIKDKRKGWHYLQAALKILKQNYPEQEVLVLIFGSNYNPEMEKTIPFKTKFLGYLSDEYSVSLVYNASDVFVLPSLADNQPTTVQESLSCGTPVVGFSLGGITDMISHKENGYLAKYCDAADVADGIQYCLQNKIKGHILPGFEPHIIFQKHKDLIATIQNQ